MRGLLVSMKKRFKLEDQQLFDSISSSIVETIQAEELWRVLGSEKTHEDHQEQFSIYASFFNAVRSTAFSTLIMGLARLSDENQSSTCLKRLINLAVSRTSGEDEETQKKLNFLLNKICSQEPVWKGLRVLRSNVFAHTSGTMAEAAAFDKAGLTPNQLSCETSVCYETFIELAVIFDISTGKISFIRHSVQQDTQKILRNLQAGREARLKKA